MVLRYKLPPGYSHPMTDVIGILEGADPIAVRAGDGRLVQVSADQVIALKSLSARPIRIGEIRNLETAAAAAWPGVEQAWIDGWLLRAGHGVTGRANSALPLGGAGAVAGFDASTIERIRQWFGDRGLPTLLLLPDRLGTAPDGWSSEKETIVMAADLGNVTLPLGPPVTSFADRPDHNWLSMYDAHGDPAYVEAVLTAVVGTATFGAIGNTDTTLAIGRAALTEAPDHKRWVGLTGIHVAPEHRRHGIGSLICGDLLSWGRENGATHAYLQVSADNFAAIALYEQLGFVEHHRYRYATDPVGG
ncbi:GNAT family N-acetyltransferase [Rhodococcus sp. D-46]|uniref:GNAT family N-acetyltransferase n=1 Tax=Rhodococcus qingshengii JCM 15477 TaxID=1303681 RepID=A0AB38RHD5_RHOSG|nr:MULTISPECIES: GNAT family N-acetyltransferase [Rhodococcus]MYV26970.1 GNAT family N-acetyltransferase [Rhodococcus erythropolis]NHE67123.1 GNAT family N-acetyltransferase [Rhodococcus sp. D-46]MBW4816196.1 GNAT family N-acetyltransferase [Rhodococcus qingshengii]QTS01851.1 GNAT family N-acetyltransferase [Rhodococcus qingshengii]UPU44502.1 GNAT family N-acetyltransferase [Rhodococcus qingshengii JCM 15477]